MKKLLVDSVHLSCQVFGLLQCPSPYFLGTRQVDQLKKLVFKMVHRQGTMRRAQEKLTRGVSSALLRFDGYGYLRLPLTGRPSCHIRGDSPEPLRVPTSVSRASNLGGQLPNTSLTMVPPISWQIHSIGRSVSVYQRF